MTNSEILDKLYKFRSVDKYDTFKKAHPSLAHTPPDQQKIIETILDSCCTELIKLFRTDKRPTKTAIKSVITSHMNEITHSGVNAENRDFGYELCWFLSEKTGSDFKFISHNKAWGFWNIESNEVKTIEMKSKPKNQSKHHQKTK